MGVAALERFGGGRSREYGRTQKQECVIFRTFALPDFISRLNELSDKWLRMQRRYEELDRENSKENSITKCNRKMKTTQTAFTILLTTPDGCKVLPHHIATPSLRHESITIGIRCSRIVEKRFRASWAGRAYVRRAERSTGR